MLSVTAAPSVPMRFARGCFDKLSMTAIFATFLPFSGFTVLAILRFHLLGRFDYLVDVALVHEGGLRKVVVLALENLLEGAHGVRQRHEPARCTGELLGGEVRLRHEALDASGATHGLLVFVAELFDTENGDDVLKVSIALKHLLHLTGDIIVLLADDQWVEDARCRREWVDRRVDAALGDGPLERQRLSLIH